MERPDSQRGAYGIPAELEEPVDGPDSDGVDSVHEENGRYAEQPGDAEPAEVAGPAESVDVEAELPEERHDDRRSTEEQVDVRVDDPVDARREDAIVEEDRCEDVPGHADHEDTDRQITEKVVKVDAEQREDKVETDAAAEVILAEPAADKDAVLAQAAATRVDARSTPVKDDRSAEQSGLPDAVSAVDKADPGEAKDRTQGSDILEEHGKEIVLFQTGDEAPAPTSLPGPMGDRLEEEYSQLEKSGVPGSIKEHLEEPVDAVTAFMGFVAVAQQGLERQTGPTMPDEIPRDEADLFSTADADRVAVEPDALRELASSKHGTDFDAALSNVDPADLVEGLITGADVDTQAENNGGFAAALERANPDRFRAEVQQMDETGMANSLRSDPIWVSSVLRAGGRGSVGTLLATGKLRKTEVELIDAFIRDDAESVLAREDPMSRVSKMRELVDGLNGMDESILEQAIMHTCYESVRRGEVPAIVSPTMPLRLRTYVDFAYGIVYGAQGARAADNLYLEIFQDIAGAEADVRRMDVFLSDTEAFRRMERPDTISDDRLQRIADETALRIDIAMHHGPSGDNPGGVQDAIRILTEAYIGVVAEQDQKYQAAAYRWNPSAIRHGDIPELPATNLEERMRLARIGYGIRMSLPPPQGGTEAADRALVEEYKGIIDTWTQQTQMGLYQDNPRGWLLGQRPQNYSPKELELMSRYTLLNVQTTLRWDGRDAASEQMLETALMVTERQIAMFQAAQASIEPVRLLQGELPRTSDAVLKEMVSEAQRTVGHVLQTQGEGAAREFLENWYGSVGDRLRGEVAAEMFMQSPTEFMGHEKEPGMSRQILDTLPIEQVEGMRDRSLGLLEKGGQEGLTANAGGRAEQWTRYLTDYAAARRYDRSGLMEGIHEDAVQEAAVRGLEGLFKNPGRVHIRSDPAGEFSPDNIAMITAAAGATVITTEGRALPPQLRDWLTKQAKAAGRPLEVPRQPLYWTGGAPTDVRVDVGPPPIGFTANKLLDDLNPGAVAFFDEQEYKEFAEEAQRLIETDPDYIAQGLTIRYVPTALVNIRPEFAYDNSQQRRTGIIFRRHANGERNRRLRELEAIEDELKLRNSEPE